jgi:CcmD family protein
MENFGYLLAAYSIIFVAIFLYVLFLWRRQSHLESELRAMEARLQSAVAPPAEIPVAAADSGEQSKPPAAP